MGISMETQQLWALFQIDQQRMGALETILMTIRGWTVTLASALAGFSLSQHHRSLLLVAMVGTVLFGLLDVRFMRTLLLHADRANKVEQVIAPEYRFRPDDPGGPPWLTWLQRRYGSPISFYVVVLLLLLLLWIAT
jgi:uncharacterized membrane protein